MRTIQKPQTPDEYPISRVQSLIDSLASKGILVSFVYGPCGPSRELLWSVDILAGNATFNRPFVAKSLLQAAEIAVAESMKAGWIE